jgi:hypothetical protein
VSHANGDHIHASNITGNGIIIGKQIHIEGDVIVNLSNEAKSNGLNLLPPKYFEDHKGTDQDFEDRKKGFSFKLSSIKERQEFRRGIVDEIKMKLDSNRIELVNLNLSQDLYY